MEKKDRIRSCIYNITAGVAIVLVSGLMLGSANEFVEGIHILMKGDDNNEKE